MAKARFSFRMYEMAPPISPYKAKASQVLGMASGQLNPASSISILATGSFHLATSASLITTVRSATFSSNDGVSSITSAKSASNTKQMAAQIRTTTPTIA